MGAYRPRILNHGKYFVSMTNEARASFRTSFGPGILFAGAAIGTSHLVQSTRAGAVFGLGLLGIVVFANVIKYPAFRFGPTYAAATGKSLLEGYRGLGRWVLAFFLLSEVAVMVIVIAATATVTAAILLAITGVTANVRTVAIGLIVVGVIALGVGGFKLLDRLTKFFVAVLTIATFAATALSLPRIEWNFAQTFFRISDLQTLGFVIALMGFMPSGMGLSVLQSLWSVAKQKATGTRPSLRHAMADFNVGYLGSAILAICFLLMGAAVMHSTGEVPATGAAAFAEQVIRLYTSNLGPWAGAIVGVSALFVMFTTLITILDGFPRMLATGIEVLRSDTTAGSPDIEKSLLQRGCTIFLVIMATLVLLFLMGSFQSFIDFVTITTFVVSPITAILNHLVILSPGVPDEFRPTAVMKAWSVVGIIALSSLSMMFIYVRFG